MMKRHLSIFVILLLAAITAVTANMGVAFGTYAPEDEKPKQQEEKPKKANADKSSLDRYREQMAQLQLEQDSIPDSLLHPRWPIQRTTPITYDDLRQGPADLQRPENMKQEVEYNDTLNRYVIGTRMGKTWLSAPIMMEQGEYLKWSEKTLFNDYFRSKNSEIFQKEGKEKFDFTDMHFDLGPAEKIFGPGGIRVKTQGTAELRLGATMKSIDNPSLPLSNRKTTTVDFDEKINVNVTGKVGDKMNMNLNYNTDATFDYDAQNMKLKYDGKEDEIIKLVEAGNVSFPSNSSLITGASSLFGVRADMQFGKLKLQTVLSQKKSSSTSVSSQGGVQLKPFELNVANYEENRHFFLDKYFHDSYDTWMSRLPTPVTSVTINRVEIWVTNKNGTTSNTRDIVAFADLGDNGYVSVPNNQQDALYQAIASNATLRNLDNVYDALEGTTQGGITMHGGVTYEKVGKARLLTSSEYSLNTAMGYVSLKTSLQTDQVLAIAYEYTSGGVTYQVGEFSTDNTATDQAIFVKALKNVECSPSQPNWDLMMKNVYYLASSVQKERFRLDVKYQSDTIGVYTTYIPDPAVKSYPIIRLQGADRLDANNRTNPNGIFDFVEGYTVNSGRVYFPMAEPFGEGLKNALIAHGMDMQTAEKYSYSELYDTTKTAAKQVAEKNRFLISGRYRGTSANVISLGAYNVPQGSVVVTAAGVTLVEGVDYSVDYSAGEVTILNQSIIDAGTSVNVSLESQSDYSMERKSMFGVNWEYDFSKDFNISGTLQHLREQSLTSKVTMGSEPVNNTLVGFNVSWKKESQWLTDMLNKIPFLHVKQPSNIQFTGEFAKLFSSIASGTQDNASYVDDFENSTYNINLLTPTSWQLSSAPKDLLTASEYNKNDLQSGYRRAKLAWYTIDQLFTNRSSSLTPSHIKGNDELLSNHYVREVYVSELYPKRDQSTYSGVTSVLPIMNLAYYPKERGPYNFSLDLTNDGLLNNPEKSWGGMMRKLDTNDFEEANIEYIEFWMLDPFIYSSRDGSASRHSGKLHINLGEVSEDILLDGKKFYESGMPVADGETTVSTQWGKIPNQTTITYAFATTDGAREKQDVGLNGLTDDEERTWYQDYLQQLPAGVQQRFAQDPAADNYHYFRGSDYDAQQLGILERYKNINNPQGNSPDSNSQTESYDTSYKSGPDLEDINQDYTLNEYEKYYDYEIDLSPEALRNNTQGYVADVRTATPPLRNGSHESVNWYLMRIPIHNATSKVGNISDFTSIRFMRMYMTGFQDSCVVRLASLNLVRGDWRVYDQTTQTLKECNPNPSAVFTASSINIEENNDKEPVNYILPPGISRVVDPSQPQLTENNEQSLRMDITGMATNDAVAVYKNTNYDMRYYKRLQMFVHANSTKDNVTGLKDYDVMLFVRLGTDYNNNYYEYDIPLKLTEHRSNYTSNSEADRLTVWPMENMLDLDLSKFTALKKKRNTEKQSGRASYNAVFSQSDPDNQKNTLKVLGNPSLGEVATMMIGIKKVGTSSAQQDVEVWVNELRLLDPESEGGWAAAANLNVQLSDLGNVQASGKYVSDGFGGLEQKVMQRTTDKYATYSVTTSLDLGKFFPEKAKVTAPLYYSVTRERTSPKYNPLDTDMKLEDALESAGDSHERDSIESIAVTKKVAKNFSLTGVRVGIATKGHPMPYDPANFTFGYSHSHNHTEGSTTVYENEDTWRGSLAYSWSPVYRSFEPFKKIKSKSKYYDILKKFALNYMPQNIAFNTEMSRYYYELQERDLEDLGASSSVPATWNSRFLWDRSFQLRWDLTRNLHMSFQSATQAEIEEPYMQVNKDLYPEQYQAWKDSVWQSIKHMGTPLDYNQSFTASYQLPLNLIPIFDWLNADASYSATYHWARGAEEDGVVKYGNTITNNRVINLNGTLNMEKLYNHSPFLKKANERFAKSPKRNNRNKNKTQTKKDSKGSKDPKDLKDSKDSKDTKTGTPKNAFVKELTIGGDTSIVIAHGKKSKRLIVSARGEDGKLIPIKYKKVDDNRIKLINKSDSTMKIKVSVVALQPLDDLKWYKFAQSAARFAMMVRNIGVTYRTQYGMTLPGFIPNAGDVFGQRSGHGTMAPGLDFAFGFIDDDYISKARSNGWLLSSADDVSTPATTTLTRDLQVKLTVEPIRNLKIDMNMAHTQSRSKSIQFMYESVPTTQSGSFSMTTISIKSAFESTGDANSGYRSASFEKFCNQLGEYRSRVESRYAATRYPTASTMSGTRFDPAKTPVKPYSADVMVPAFLNAYTGYSGLSIFPTIASMLPNWSLRYSGLSQLSWFRERFKSININHAYKSIYSVGSYSSFSSFQKVMGDEIGFVTDATTGDPTPSSMFNVSTVSINETFSPLLGVDVTLKNNMTLKAEYRSTRVLSLSMTSVQINETTSKDWVFGMGYKINDFRFTKSRALKAAKSRSKSGSGNDDDDSKSKSTRSTKSKGKTDFAHDLNLRLDVSYRRQAAITRDIATVTSTATSGNTAFKLAFTADYTLSRLLTMSLYYDRQSNTPLLSSGSYPTVTQDFGVSMKFSLTR
ncbi:MAG: cell surface protein SprA [Prevotella sp.]|nr:cell surface protein SprA [Prevotella sp.]